MLDVGVDAGGMGEAVNSHDLRAFVIGRRARVQQLGQGIDVAITVTGRRQRAKPEASTMDGGIHDRIGVEGQICPRSGPAFALATLARHHSICLVDAVDAFESGQQGIEVAGVG